MEELPSNSHRSKPRREDPAKKRVEPVIQGEVIQRKKSVFKRIGESFFASRADTVGEAIVWDLLIPAAKDTVSDMASSFVDRMLFGDSRLSAGRRSTRGGHGSYGGPINYSRGINHGSQMIDRRSESRAISIRGNRGPALDEIVLNTRVEAEMVLDGLAELIIEYNAATVADLYGLLGKTGSFTDDKWGWTDIHEAGVQKVYDGYLLLLPRPEPLD